MPSRGEETRLRILDAAWEASDRRADQVILAGLSVRDVAAAAGTSPSTVAYHFPTMRDLALAMVDHLGESVSTIPVELVEGLLDGVSADGLLMSIRAAAQANWQSLNTPEELVFERRYARCYAAMCGEDGEWVRKSLDRSNSWWIGTLAAAYCRASEATGVRLIEPFDFHELALCLAAISEGLTRSAVTSPGTVSDTLAADAIVALLSSVLVPAPQTITLDEKALAIGLRQATATTVADVRDAEALAPLFLTGWEDVTFTRVSQELGCKASDVANRFGTIRRLAAMSFHRHLGSISNAVGRRADAGAEVSLTDGVHELARAVVSDRHCALALLHERQCAAIGPLPEEPGRDVRSLVPLGAVLSRPLAELSPDTESKVADLADLLVDTVLGFGATHPRRPLNSICATALRLVPFSDNLTRGPRRGAGSPVEQAE